MHHVFFHEKMCERRTLRTWKSMRFDCMENDEAFSRSLVSNFMHCIIVRVLRFFKNLFWNQHEKLSLWREAGARFFKNRSTLIIVKDSMSYRDFLSNFSFGWTKVWSSFSWQMKRKNFLPLLTSSSMMSSHIFHTRTAEKYFTWNSQIDNEIRAPEVIFFK